MSCFNRLRCGDVQERVSGHPQMIKIRRGSVTLEISDTLSRKCDRECDRECDRVMEFSVINFLGISQY